jgi:hypothetical protein
MPLVWRKVVFRSSLKQRLISALLKVVLSV